MRELIRKSSTNSKGELEMIERPHKSEKPKECPKECPFCTGVDIRLAEYLQWRYMLCDECQSSGPIGETDEEALEGWNTRPNDNRTAPELICPDCGEELVKMSYELEDGSGWMHGYLCGCKEEK